MRADHGSEAPPAVAKVERQRLIREIITAQAVETQEQLAEALRGDGVSVTQATVSRDIRELRLTKLPTDDGGYRYVVPHERPSGDTMRLARRMFRDFVLGTDDSANMVVVKTLPGTAQGVGAVVDAFAWPDVIGTIAGDDTLLIIVKPIEAVETVLSRLRRLESDMPPADC